MFSVCGQLRGSSGLKDFSSRSRTCAETPSVGTTLGQSCQNLTREVLSAPPRRRFGTILQALTIHPRHRPRNESARHRDQPRGLGSKTIDLPRSMPGDCCRYSAYFLSCESGSAAPTRRLNPPNRNSEPGIFLPVRQ
jgi:hypothetical protein